MQAPASSLKPLLACVALVFADLACAETSPYYVGASEALSYQTNVYTAQFNPVSSGISTTSLIGGFDQPIGRQRVFASGAVGYNYYTNAAARALNNTSYGLNAGLDWQTIENLSGTVRLAANQNLLSGSNPQTNAQKNMQTLLQAILTARYQIIPSLAIEGGYGFHKVDNSAPNYASQEFSQNGVSLGLRYGQSALNVGVALRANRADYPRYLVNTNPATAAAMPYIADQATGKFVDFTVGWVPNGLSSLDARLSLADISHDVNTAANYSGLTGELGWNYQFSGKLSTRLSLLVAPGTSATFFGANGLGQIALDNSTLTKIFSFSANYLLTGKTTLTGNVGLVQNRYDQATALGVQGGTDLAPSVGLGFTYAATRNSLLGCNVGYVKRSASNEATALGMSYPYSSTTYTCSGQITLQ